MTALKFKYNRHQIFAVIELYERTVLTDASSSIEDRLLLSLLLGVYDRLRKMTIEIKDNYLLKYSIPEALAYMLYFKDVVPISPYEMRLINMTIQDVDRKLL